MKRNYIFALFAAASLLSANASTPAYLDPTQDIEVRVDDALSRMTRAEKIALIHAQSKFSSPGVPRLGIPEIWCADGPHGVRPEVKWDEWNQADWTNDSCVVFPTLTCLAATWNPAMAHDYGKALGEEARYRRKTVILGPGINICRTPLNGRNFEYMGEDPFLTGAMVAPYLRGVQKNGVAACVKHFALNNQEKYRLDLNVVVDDRALHEIYLPAFHAAVADGGAWAIMGAYNLYNNEHCCHNSILLNDILKRDWGFDGTVISDWGGAHNTLQAATNGLDLEFGSWTEDENHNIEDDYDHFFLAKPYMALLDSGEVDTLTLDDKARRALRLIMRTEMNPSRPFGSFRSPEHYATARQVATEGIVLLKNDRNVLPLDTAKLSNILVVGENAIKMLAVGGGSSSLKAQREITPLQGIIEALAASKVKVDYERGYVGDPCNEYNGVSTRQSLTDDRTPQARVADAIAMARKADAVVFIGGLNKTTGQDSEAFDRNDMRLPYGQDSIIAALADANPNFVYVNVAGCAVEMPWIDKVPAVLHVWHLGSEAGPAIAEILLGDANPSGKLPVTFYASLDQCGAHATGEYPGRRRPDGKTYEVEYNDGIFVGYRYTDAHKLKPLFPFGHGLSYTTFKFSKPVIDSKKMSADGTVTITFDITNTGSKAGAEVAQLYIRDVKSSLPRPVKELKAFEKVYLQPGQTKTVSFTITDDMLRFYDDSIGSFRSEPGDFEAIIATSAADTKAKVPFTLL